MAEATQRLQQDKLRASMAFAARVRALQLATNEVKVQLQRQGLRLSQVTYRELRVSAEQYLADHREELFASAKVDVERWRLKGVFGNGLAGWRTRTGCRGKTQGAYACLKISNPVPTDVDG